MVSMRTPCESSSSFSTLKDGGRTAMGNGRAVFDLGLKNCSKLPSEILLRELPGLEGG